MSVNDARQFVGVITAMRCVVSGMSELRPWVGFPVGVCDSLSAHLVRLAGGSSWSGGHGSTASMCMSVCCACMRRGWGPRVRSPRQYSYHRVTNSALNVYYAALTPYITTSTKHKIWQTLVYDVNYMGCVAKGPATRLCRACASQSALRVRCCVCVWCCV